MLWKGTLELDEIAIPVGLASTISEKSERLRRIHAGCGIPATLRGYCERHEKLLDPDEIADAWEPSPGEYLLVDADAKAALEPAETRHMPIGVFVPADAIPGALVKKRYQLVPVFAGARAYFLFAATLAELDVAGLVRFTAWRSEQLGALHSHDGRLELHTLHFFEDLAERDDTIGHLLDEVGAIDDNLLELARELVRRHSRPLRPGDLDSTQRPEVRRLLERLLAGEKILRPEPPMQENERPATSADLEGALRRSLKQAPRRHKPAAAR